MESRHFPQSSDGLISAGAISGNKRRIFRAESGCAWQITLLVGLFLGILSTWQGGFEIAA